MGRSAGAKPFCAPGTVPHALAAARTRSARSASTAAPIAIRRGNCPAILPPLPSQPGINRLAGRFPGDNPDKWPPLRAASRVPNRRWPVMRPMSHEPSHGAGGKWASQVPSSASHQPTDMSNVMVCRISGSSARRARNISFWPPVGCPGCGR